MTEVRRSMVVYRLNEEYSKESDDESGDERKKRVKAKPYKL